MALTLKVRERLFSLASRIIAIVGFLSACALLSYGALMIAGTLFASSFVLMLVFIWLAGGQMQQQWILQILQAKGGQVRRDDIIAECLNEAMNRSRREVRTSDVASYATSLIRRLEKKRLIRVDQGIVYLQEAGKTNL